jgi:hypothetical protein
MFNILVNLFKNAGVASPSTAVLSMHPAQLSRWLDEVWGEGPKFSNLPQVPSTTGTPFLGAPDIVETFDTPPIGAFPFTGASGINPANLLIPTTSPGPVAVPAGGTPPAVPLIWHHLIYAYLIENTGVVEIFSEVIRRAFQGETLEITSKEALRWLRATEELFFREPPLFSIASVTSHLRPDSRVVRRNAYWRMFGMDLSHPIPPRWMTPSLGAQSWKQDVGAGVNTSFREKWSELLRQVWLGYENRKNAVGANATDDAYLVLLTDALRDMLNMRRRGGFLAREEFVSVAMMNWFDLTLSDNTPIVQALNAHATTREDRLALIARAVGMSPAPRSRELFELAELMSIILRVIEFNAITSATVGTLYIEGQPISRTMNEIVDLWQSATGERVKDRPIGNVVLPSQVSQQPMRIPASQPVTSPRLVAAGNGGRP